MQFNDNQIATYLFCAALPSSRTNGLTIIEWNVLVQALCKENFEPKDLYELPSSKLEIILSDAKNSQISNIIKKINARKELGMALTEMEKVINQGVSIVFRKDIPNKLKKLGSKLLPPFFYAVGDLSIFAGRTLGVVGARDASADELAITREIGKDAANESIAIVSGGARGVDREAATACLNAGGKAIIFCSDGIGKHIKDKRNRELITENKLVFLSAQHINASFQAGYAMQRNKYIHASGDHVVVTSSTISGSKKSGTWEGVVENYKAGWTPILAYGNSKGVQKMLETGMAQPFIGVKHLEVNEKKPEGVNTQSNIEQLFKTSLKKAIESDLSKEEVKQIFNKAINNIYGTQDKNQNFQQLNLLD
ncbi:MAG: DNA-protecting protein DprA [Bacillus sp. (in: Bacteria)]|nr:DNA-protecting protein DprA [Bacillus sp. (in: firmicutes)]